MRSSAWCLAVIGTLVAALAPGEAAATTSRIAVRNQTGDVVCYVYVSPCASDSWGDDILAEDVLQNGASTTIRVQTGCWDLKAEDCSRNVVATQRGLDVTGPTTWTLGGSQAAPRAGAALRINNRSGVQVCYVYVSPCASDSWGEDILAEDVLPDGSNTSVMVQTGCWDLKAEDCSRNVVATRRGLQVSGSATWTLERSQPATVSLEIKNRTGATVCYVYVSPCASDDWGDDILEQDVLPTGQSARVRVQPGCWDIKAEDCDRATIGTRTGFRINRNTSWTVRRPRPR